MASGEPSIGSPPLSAHNIEDLLMNSSKKFSPGECKVLKRYMIKPSVIYLKNGRDKVLVSTEKNNTAYPQDEYGYFGGFSPSRKDIYQNEHLVKKYREENKKKGSVPKVRVEPVDDSTHKVSDHGQALQHLQSLNFLNYSDK